MCLQSIPDHQQRLLEMSLQCFEEIDDLFVLDAALVQPNIQWVRVSPAMIET